MNEAWFSVEVADSLKWLSLLSLLGLLVIFPLQGRYRTAVTTVWIAAVILGAVCLGIFALALGRGQPGHVTYPFLATGIALTVAFGGTFFPMRSGYREAELRKTVARDI
jgi:hypothetical protein